MSLFAIGDTHLSLGSAKPMDVFGGRWENYTEKLERGFRETLTDSDVCVVCGDVSWAMELPDAAEDMHFLSRLPGRKILLKGNHDYWWSSAAKMRAFLEKEGIDNIDILHNNFFPYGENAAVCGTKGWFYEEESGGEHDKKIMLREIGRLETSLKAAGDREKYVFLHYPPKYGAYECPDILALLEKYGVKVCCSGHIHSMGLKNVYSGVCGGTLHVPVSADNIKFRPVKILD